MNSRVLVVGVISVTVFGVFLLKGTRDNNKVVQGVQSKATASDENTETSLESKVKSMGAVEVEVTPVSIKLGSKMIFDVALNTHSVDLSYDYTNIIKAEDAKGNVYEAISWSGDKGGHHLRGEVELEPLIEDTRTIKLNIKGIDNQNAVFEWEL